MLVTVLIIAILLALALYAARMIPMDARLAMLIQVVIVVIAILYIARAAGLA
jgi:hypothetical protein